MREGGLEVESFLQNQGAIGQLSLSILAMSEDDARRLVNTIKENKTLTYVKLVYCGGHTQEEVAMIKAIFKGADRG